MEVLKGLAIEHQVIVLGQNGLKDGAKVRIVIEGGSSANEEDAGNGEDPEEGGEDDSKGSGQR